MRLLKLRVRNIASLRGEHTIDFSEIQRQSPLFAITGETGAGKSTILNSIGLSLYGRLFKTSLQSSDVVTLGEKDGQIDLILTVKGKNYLASWRTRVRKQNGEAYATPPSPSRELYELQGDEFDSPKRIAVSKIEDILNLDFDQFSKCVILNQGEFARFLTSSFTERKDILEKLYPGEVLENLSRTLRSELAEIEKNLSDLEINLSTLEEESSGLENLTQKIEEFKNKLSLDEVILSHVEKTKNHFISLINYQRNFLDTNRKITISKNDLSDLTTKQNTFLLNVRKNEEAFLEAQKEELQERPKLLELLEKEKELNLSHERLKVLEKKLLELTQEEKLHQEKKKTLELRFLELKTEKEKLSPYLTQSFEELKTHQSNIEEVFEKFHELTLLEQETQSVQQKLKEVELSGKESSKKLEDLRASLLTFSPDLENELEEIKKTKLKLQELSDTKQKALLKYQSIEEDLKKLQLQQNSSIERSSWLDNHSKDLESEIKNLESSLKLSQLMEAVEVCLNHVDSACPVCHSDLSSGQINHLKKDFKKIDPQMRTRLQEASKTLLKYQEEASFTKKTLKEISEDIKAKEALKESLSQNAHIEIASTSEIETQLALAQKKIWDRDKLLQDEKRIQLETQEARTLYRDTKVKLTTSETRLKESQERINLLTSELSSIFPTGLTKENIQSLKNELKHFKNLDVVEKQIDKNSQEIIYEEKVYARFLTEKSSVEAEKIHLQEANIQIQNHLKEKLGDLKASDKLSVLSALVKKFQDQWKADENLLKAEQLKMKEIQGRLYNYEELKKDFEIRFSQEKQNVRDSGLRGLTHSTEIFQSFAHLSVDLETPEELLTPLETLLQNHESAHKNSLLDLRDKVSQLSSQKDASEKRQDKMSLLRLKKKEILEKFNRLARLESILGKDELRTFVLALVEENLITQTNKELELLCQGRYEIVHQTRGMKMAPEFFILDKFREGGLRKVSTLSGGETFMVSLAMALGLAEMTRGQAEIDSLFIDEGFGTLDQDSLTDVLEVLNQIQTRGLMVGIISHIKTLTQSLPVNLLLNKRSDGTSSIKVTYN